MRFSAIKLPWSRLWWLTFGIVFLCLLAGTALYTYRQYMRYLYFAEHDPGRVFRSAWLEPDVYAEQIRKHKIRTVINLCESGEKLHRIDGQRQAVEQAGARLVELTFPANRTWSVDRPVFAEYEAVLQDPQSYPIWIHCWHGRERTVKALAIYDILIRHKTAHDSLSAMPLWRRAHPWPIVAFAYNYEAHRDVIRAAANHVRPATGDDAMVKSTAAKLRSTRQ